MQCIYIVAEVSGLRSNQCLFPNILGAGTPSSPKELARINCYVGNALIPERIRGNQLLYRGRGRPLSQNI